MRRILTTLGLALGLILSLSGVAQAVGPRSFCTTGNSQAAFLVKATNSSGSTVEYFVPIGQCAGGNSGNHMGTDPFAFHVPTGWGAEFLQAPNGKHYWARGSDGGSGGQWVEFAGYSSVGEWWARHFRY